MKTKILFFRWAITLLLAMSSLVTWGQSTTDPDRACLNSTEDYWVLPTVGSTYGWVLSGGGTITPGSTTDKIKVNWTSTGPYTLTVIETITSTGCIGEAKILNITVDALPTPGITGNLTACLNSTGNIYSSEAGKTSYVWAVTGGTITAGQGTSAATITWDVTGAKSVSVNYTNAAGCTAASPTVYNVTVNALPVPTISGPLAACLNSTGNIYSTESGMTNYVWAITGGTITAGETTYQPTIKWEATGAKSVSVNYTNAAGCTAASPTVYNVTVNALPVVTISGNAAACLNSTGNIYSTESGKTSYVWAVTGGIITAGQGTSAATITWDVTGANSVSVNYANAAGCVAASPTVKNVTVNDILLRTVSGNATACLNSTGNVYTTESGMTNYVWTVIGGEITSGGTSATVTIKWTTEGAGSVSANYTAGASCYGTSPTIYNVTVNPLPATSPIWHN